MAISKTLSTFSAVTDFTVTMERSAVMTFSQPITLIYHSLFIKNPAGRPNYTAYTEPLHWNAWAAVGILILISPPFLYLAARLDTSTFTLILGTIMHLPITEPIS